MRDMMVEPADEDVAWLAAATQDDRDRATWELRYLRRALGLLVAERDALDDRTASAVAHELTAAMSQDRRVDAPRIRLAERQLNERLSAYREMMAMRGTAEGLEARVGRTLLLLAGATRMGPDDLAQATRLATRYLAETGERLRVAFGAATLPGSTGT
ncbi:MAG: hypothetical protein IT361_08525 [Gemmatimonadaceae bacterium]|nr:hypothetical protein [Gemmatimonadaceae bacterium]